MTNVFIKMKAKENCLTKKQLAKTLCIFILYIKEKNSNILNKFKSKGDIL